MDRVTFRSAHVGETKNLVFDFISLLAIGETISSADVGSAVYSGAASASVALGTPAVSGTKVTVTAAGDTEGVTHLITMTVVTSLGQTLPLSGFFALVPAAL